MRGWRCLLAGAPVALFALGPVDRLPGQVPGDLARERSEWEAWLRTAPTSPFAVVAQTPIGSGVTLGPADADVPLVGVALARVTEEAGAVYLQMGSDRRTLVRNRGTSLGTYTLRLSGPPRQGVLAVYGKPAGARAPTYFPYDPSLVFTVSLNPPARPGPQRLLTLEGVVVEAVGAGSVVVPLASGSPSLQVMRIPDLESDESDLMIYFRDGTNGEGSYPAGRFVSLIPVGAGNYRLDFNRARNPFCAYSTVYACPAPWPGNAIPAPVRAGEQYHAGATPLAPHR